MTQQDGSAEPVLAARGMDVGYGQVPVVHGVDIDVRAGELVALLGPNGAGKTTTLLALAGALRPSRGDVLMGGQVVRTTLDQRARAGMAVVPQERSVFGRLTVDENLRVGRCVADDALELFPELAGRRHLEARFLSGGEQQMLTLGRALARRPSVLLVDELSLGLAPKVVNRLLTALRAAADRGVGVLLVEQHLRTALRVADRAYVLRRGRIELSGSAQELARDVADVERTYFGADLSDEHR